MVLGNLDGDIPFKSLLERAFNNVKYKLNYHKDMNGWLISHIVPVLVTSYVSYLSGGNTKKVAKDKKLIMQMVGAMDEGFKVLENVGYTVTPVN